MNRSVTSVVIRAFLVNTILVIVTGCNSLLTPAVQLPTTIPLPLNSPTTLPPYLHYTSASWSDIYLEFNYPSSWGFGEDLSNDRLLVALYEPRYSTLPTPFPSDNHPPFNDFGVIDISVYLIHPDETFEQLVEEYITLVEHHWYVMPLNKYSGRIGGQDAVIFEYKISKDNPEIYPSEMFIREIFLSVNRLIYQIGFQIAEKDRGNEFEQGYEYFLNSLRVAP